MSGNYNIRNPSTVLLMFHCNFAAYNFTNERKENMKKLLVFAAALMGTMMLHAQSVVYMTKEISPESLVRIYKALGVPAHGRVAVKISSGEMGGNNYLKPTLIRNLVDEVNGTLVECCTAYGGSRQDKGKHWETIHAHGFDSIAPST